MARTLAIGHLCVAVAAIVMVVVMVVAGTRPEAELEGLYLLGGVVLALPTAAFTGAAVRCARSSFGDAEGAWWSAVVGVTEVASGAAFAAGVAVSGTPARSPCLLPALVLLTLGLATVGRTVASAHRP